MRCAVAFSNRAAASRARASRRGRPRRERGAGAVGENERWIQATSQAQRARNHGAEVVFVLIAPVLAWRCSASISAGEGPRFLLCLCTIAHRARDRLREGVLALRHALLEALHDPPAQLGFVAHHRAQAETSRRLRLALRGREDALPQDRVEELLPVRALPDDQNRVLGSRQALLHFGRDPLDRGGGVLSQLTGRTEEREEVSRLVSHFLEERGFSAGVHLGAYLAIMARRVKTETGSPSRAPPTPTRAARHTERPPPRAADSPPRGRPGPRSRRPRSGATHSCPRRSW